MDRLTKRAEDGTPALAGALSADKLTESMNSSTKVVFCDLMKRLAAYEDEEEQGRLVRLPVKVGDKVFTIQERCFDCQNCSYKEEAEFDSKIKVSVCNAFGETRHCPLYIAEHKVEGYEVLSCDKIYGPGEWGYERLEEFEDGAFDGKWYLTRAEAEAAMNRMGGG